MNRAMIALAAWLPTFFCAAVSGADSPEDSLFAGHIPAADASTRQLHKEVVVSAPVEAVWDAWTTRAGVTSFGPPEAKIELRVGGAYEWYFIPDAPPGDRGSDGCRVLSFVPNRMLSFSWNAPPSLAALRESGARTHVVLDFEPLDGGRVKVSLTQVGFGQGEVWDKYYEYFDNAWSYVLQNLERRFSARQGGGPTAAEAKSPEPAAPPAGTDPGTHWVFFIRPARPGFFTKMTPMEQEKITGHKAYLSRLVEEGTAVFAGRTLDPAYYPDDIEAGVMLDMPAVGIVVFQAGTVEEAKRIMQADPAVEAGVFKACLHPFGLAFNR